MKKANKFLLIFTLMLFSLMTFSQGYIKGVILDADNNEGLIGATVILEGTTTGTTTVLDGSFIFKAPAGEYSLNISFIGYAPQTKTINVVDGKTIDLGKILLKSNAIALNEINIFADVAVQRKTPVAVSAVSAKTIERELGNQEFPEVMKMTPGVYATKQGGGFGDSRINVRGFDQKNVAVMINGIPVNDMENGWVYWSNWSGLSDATRTMQVQRGLGASKLAINSVGGTINIITKTTDAKKGGFISSSFTDYGTKKTKLGLNTGLMKGGWAVSFIGSRTEGNGYIDATWIDAWSYFLSISKQINKNHQLVFTAIGAPQKHGQRVGDKYHALSEETKEKYGNKYNSGWGYLDGKKMCEKTNYYHKPQIALNWYWNISDKAFLSTSAYVSFGRGGGSGLLGQGWYKYNVNKTANGWYDWNLSRDANESGYNAAGEAVYANDTSTIYDGSKQILRNSVNSHNWFGILSTLNYDLSDNLKLTAGFDGRYYKGMHYREVRDLLGGDYWDDSYKSYKSGNSRAQVGDKIDYFNDGFVSYAGLFSQLEYSAGNFSSFIAASASDTWYKRIDYFNYDDNVYLEEADYEGVESDWESQIGYNFKTGLNYNLNENNNVFINAGYYARAPFFDYVFINYSNDVNSEYTTEKVMAGEIGYGYNGKYISARINGYYTSWKDRWLDGYYTDPNTGAGSTVYFQGLEEIHYGVEAELNANVTKDFQLAGQLSLGKWYYSNDVDITIYDDNRQPIGEAAIYTKDLRIADAPQTQLGIAAKWQVTKQIDLGANWVYYDKLYSKFDPEGRKYEDEAGVNSYELPSYNVLDFRAGFAFKIAGLRSYASANVYNALDTEYWAEGWDNAQRDSNHQYAHNSENFAGFLGWGRNVNFSLRVNF
ncbi:MAG: TonB-dependent receptor [Bacteroidales bacterium]|nr:TonB-dependent receptor [Bacteroidales bacterium]